MSPVNRSESSNECKNIRNFLWGLHAAKGQNLFTSSRFLREVAVFKVVRVTVHGKEEGCAIGVSSAVTDSLGVPGHVVSQIPEVKDVNPWKEM